MWQTFVPWSYATLSSLIMCPPLLLHPPECFISSSTISAPSVPSSMESSGSDILKVPITKLSRVRQLAYGIDKAKNVHVILWKDAAHQVVSFCLHLDEDDDVAKEDHKSWGMMYGEISQPRSHHMLSKHILPAPTSLYNVLLYHRQIALRVHLCCICTTSMPLRLDIPFSRRSRWCINDPEQQIRHHALVRTKHRNLLGRLALAKPMFVLRQKVASGSTIRRT
jgi:hypothetical protein